MVIREEKGADMSAFFTPILGFVHDPWAAGAAFLCIGALALGALIRSRFGRGEGAH